MERPKESTRKSSRAPNPIEFAKGFYDAWIGIMAGVLGVLAWIASRFSWYDAIANYWLLASGVLAIMAGSYRVWSKERERVTYLESLTPRFRCALEQWRLYTQDGDATQRIALWLSIYNDGEPSLAEGYELQIKLGSHGVVYGRPCQHLREFTIRVPSSLDLHIAPDDYLTVHTREPVARAGKRVGWLTFELPGITPDQLKTIDSGIWTIGLRDSSGNQHMCPLTVRPADSLLRVVPGSPVPYKLEPRDDQLFELHIEPKGRETKYEGQHPNRTTYCVIGLSIINNGAPTTLRNWVVALIFRDRVVAWDVSHHSSRSLNPSGHSCYLSGDLGRNDLLQRDSHRDGAVVFALPSDVSEDALWHDAIWYVQFQDARDGIYLWPDPQKFEAGEAFRWLDPISFAPVK